MIRKVENLQCFGRSWHPSVGLLPSKLVLGASNITGIQLFSETVFLTVRGGLFQGPGAGAVKFRGEGRPRPLVDL